MSDEKDRAIREMTGYGFNDPPCECVIDPGHCGCGNTGDCMEAFYWKGVKDTLEHLIKQGKE